jgi:type I restriction enzyme, S subunit
MSFPRYPEYKDSGVKWLGEVPGHWGVKRLKHNLRLLTEKADRRENPVALENIEGWTGRFIATDTEFLGEGVAFATNDILFGKLRPYLAKVYRAETQGEAVGDFHVMRPGPSMDSRFAQYQILNRTFIDIVDGSTFGSKMPRASWEFVGGMEVTTPPLTEQTQIAAFLDQETAKIDALVEEQRLLMELLKEKRQAVISHAVTRGLNPDAPMKPSGIEWLGDVPDHWAVTKIKRLVDTFEQGWSPQCEGFPVESDQEWGVLKVGCVNGGTFKPEENKTLPQELEPIPSLGIAMGDLLISRANTRELVGSAAVAKQDHKNLLLCDKLYRLRFPMNICSPEFIAHYLGTGMARGQIELAATGASSSMVNIAQSTILELELALPGIQEQQAIVSYFEAESAKFDTLITEAHSAVDLLQERRTALISAAVTGQIDVRNAVAA